MSQGIQVAEIIDELRADPHLYPAQRSPHPKAAELVLPNGFDAPEDLREWAAFDNSYPWHLATRRSGQLIADPRGVLLVQPMLKVLNWVCHDSIAEELEDDPETSEYLHGLARKLAQQFHGFGVVLEPKDQPDRVLWLTARGHATVMWYENDSFRHRVQFRQWLAEVCLD